MVYFMSGYEGYALLALPLSATGDISGSDAIVWSSRRGTPYVPSPLLYDDMLYFSQSNQFSILYRTPRVESFARLTQTKT